MDNTPVATALMRSMQLDPRLAKASPAVIRRFGISTENSVFDLLPEQIQSLALSIPADIVDLPEEELERLYPPARHDRRLRAAFWDEYEAAARQLRPVDPDKVVIGTGISSWLSYEERLRSTPALASWFLTPPVQYRVALKEAMSLSISRLLDVLELPLLSPKGHPNVGVGLLILQAVKFLDARLHGAITQKQINVSLEQTAPSQDASVDMRKIDTRLAELEQQLVEKSFTTPPPSPEEPTDAVLVPASPEAVSENEPLY